MKRLPDPIRRNYVTRTEAADMRGLTPGAFRAAVAAGRLPGPALHVQGVALWSRAAMRQLPREPVPPEPQPQSPDDELTLGAVAQLKRCSRATVRRRVKRGQLPAPELMKGKRKLWLRSQFEIPE